MSETRTVTTLFGNVAVTFSEEGQNTVAGDPAALRELDRALTANVNRWGIGVTAQSLNPDDLEFIAETPGSGIGLLPADDQEPPDDGPPPPPDSPDDDQGPTLDGVKALPDRGVNNPFVTITPKGMVRAFFGEGRGVELDGPDAAVAHVAQVITNTTGRHGSSLALDSIDPADYFNLCQPEGSGMRIIEPASTPVVPVRETFTAPVFSARLDDVGSGYASWLNQLIHELQRFGKSRLDADTMIAQRQTAVQSAYASGKGAAEFASILTGIPPVAQNVTAPPAVPVQPLPSMPSIPADPPSTPVPSLVAPPTPAPTPDAGFGVYVNQVLHQIKRYGKSVNQAQEVLNDNEAEVRENFNLGTDPNVLAAQLLGVKTMASLDDAGAGYAAWLFSAVRELQRMGAQRELAEDLCSSSGQSAYSAGTDAVTFAAGLRDKIPTAPVPDGTNAPGELNPNPDAPALAAPQVVAASMAAPTPLPATQGGFGDFTVEVFRLLKQAGKSATDAQRIVDASQAKLQAAFDAQQAPAAVAQSLMGAQPKLDDVEASLRGAGTRDQAAGLVNVFKEGDKVISLDGNKDLTVTAQKGYKVYCRAMPGWLHANRLRLASGKPVDRVVMDDAGEDKRKGSATGEHEGGSVLSQNLMQEGGVTTGDGLDGVEDFDPEAEFDACEPDDENDAKMDGVVLDGDFPGHPFRGNQYAHSSRASGAAVHASKTAKRAEGKGDHKATKSAHKAAHYAHLAAAQNATSKAKHYHTVMAKFHGERAKAKSRLDSIQDPTVVLDDSDNWHSKTMAAMTKMSEDQLRYIIKDAAEAAEAGEKMTPPNPKAGQYRDEVHYAQMELKRRKDGGKKLDGTAADFHRNLKAALGQGPKLDGVEEIPGLRAQLAGAADVLAKLAIAQAIQSARAAPAVAVNANPTAILAERGYKLLSDGYTWVQAFMSPDGKTKHLVNIKALSEGKASASRSTSFPGTGMTGAPTKQLGTFPSIAAALEAVDKDLAERGVAPAVVVQPEPPAAIEIPPQVKTALDAKLALVRDLAAGLERARQTDKQFGGGGRYGAEVWREMGGDERLKTEAASIEAALAGIPNEAFRAAAAAYIKANRARPALTEQEANYFGRSEPGAAPTAAEKAAAVDAAYRFADASQDFKAWVYATMSDDAYSPFLTAKTMDATAKAGGASIAWRATNPAQWDQTYGTRDPAGTVTKGGAVIGRIEMGADGKAMVFLGASGTDRVKYAGSGQDHFFSQDPETTATMITDLLRMTGAPAAPAAVAVTEADLPALAEKIAESMHGQAHKALEFAAASPDRFQEAVMLTVGTSASGTKYTVSDPGKLSQMVIDKLKAMVPAEPQPEPQPEPAPVTDPAVTPAAEGGERADDLALLSLVASGKHPDMLEPELMELIEGAITRNPNDAQIQAEGEKAINAYMEFALANT